MTSTFQCPLFEGSVTPNPGPASTPERVLPVIFIDLTRDDDGSASESSTPWRKGTPIGLTQGDDEPAPGARKRKFGSPELDARDQSDGFWGSSPRNGRGGRSPPVRPPRQLPRPPIHLLHRLLTALRFRFAYRRPFHYDPRITLY
ncbi:hypothetical protein MAPG_09341 [Magnaporthiopsis poae ATCC 64411]|uniref:Uncharacterized protein n=1 Tax=Magnaporthiopsis poae (strain ATCC 64411 / 73-15) TaxID=644358 RepID=A0A0C4E9P5_MAGP6|nr:hypothetical protein MAPG_09341 [Magnaporthiopsis poae ATCC 64411]